MGLITKLPDPVVPIVRVVVGCLLDYELGS